MEQVVVYFLVCQEVFCARMVLLAVLLKELPVMAMGDVCKHLKVAPMDFICAQAKIVVPWVRCAAPRELAVSRYHNAP